MMFGVDDATSQVVNLERKIAKDKMRFAVGKTDGFASGVWSAWNQKSEFYVGARGALGNTKVSLHKSGKCRFGLTAEALPLTDPKALSETGDRAFVKWNRSIGPTDGAYLALAITFPTDYLHLPAPKGSAKKPLLIFEAAPPGRAAQFGFFFSQEDPKTLEPKFLKIGKPLFYWGLPNGEAVWIVVRETEFDPAVIPSAEVLSRASRVLDPAGLENARKSSNPLNCMLWNRPKDGDPLQIIEIGGVRIT
jgi:hypothetical protein